MSQNAPRPGSTQTSPNSDRAGGEDLGEITMDNLPERNWRKSKEMCLLRPPIVDEEQRKATPVIRDAERLLLSDQRKRSNQRKKTWQAFAAIRSNADMRVFLRVCREVHPGPMSSYREASWQARVIPPQVLAAATREKGSQGSPGNVRYAEDRRRRRATGCL
jgi:hypothetical protein